MITCTAISPWASSASVRSESAIERSCSAGSSRAASTTCRYARLAAVEGRHGGVVEGVQARQLGHPARQELVVEQHPCQPSWVDTRSGAWRSPTRRRRARQPSRSRSGRPGGECSSRAGSRCRNAGPRTPAARTRQGRRPGARRARPGLLHRRRGGARRGAGYEPLGSTCSSVSSARAMVNCGLRTAAADLRPSPSTPNTTASRSGKNASTRSDAPPMSTTGRDGGIPSRAMRSAATW